MKRINKSFLAISLLLWVTSFSYTLADMEISNWDSSIKMWDDWSMTVSSSWSTIQMGSSSNNNSEVTLKWKIDWYKVILTWNKYEWNNNILGYKILFTSPSWEQKTISVDPSKTSIDNWDARTWLNKYVLVVVWEDSDLAESNSIVLSMWPNGWYDFSNWNNKKDDNKKDDNKKWDDNKKDDNKKWDDNKKDDNKKWDDNKKDDNKKWDEKNSEKPNFWTWWSEQTKDQIKENKDEIKWNIGEFRKDNWFLEQYLSWYTQEVRKQILDMKKEYQDKVFYIVKSSSWALSDEQKAKIDSLNEEFMSKVEPLVWDNEKVLEFLKLRYDVFKDNQNLRDENKDMRQEFKDKFWQTNSWTTLNKNKDTTQEKWNQTLKDKYKKIFQKSIEAKIANLTSEQINLVISKIDALVVKYKSSEDLSSDQKLKFVSQLQAIRDILSDKLLETEDTINLDEIFQ
jgi:hypothetical protein